MVLWDVRSLKTLSIHSQSQEEYKRLKEKYKKKPAPEEDEEEEEAEEEEEEEEKDEKPVVKKNGVLGTKRVWMIIIWKYK